MRRASFVVAVAAVVAVFSVACGPNEETPHDHGYPVPAPADPAPQPPATSSTYTTPKPEPDPAPVPPKPQPTYYANCAEAKAAGATPLRRGESGYRSALDRDNDGVACES
jgi:hypothetical protein